MHLSSLFQLYHIELLFTRKMGKSDRSQAITASLEAGPFPFSMEGADIQKILPFPLDSQATLFYNIVARYLVIHNSWEAGL